ncbi:hypothetical protein HNP40_002186 [Mycobacteroides chelonae]|nr:hypothetical protein [Mycobacteroides chelonae]
MMRGIGQPACAAHNAAPRGAEIGFLNDSGQYAAGHVRWMQGPLKIGFFGAKGSGGLRAIEAWRCPKCGHLELFAGKWL